MINVIKMEILKLRRSWIFIVSVLSCCVLPLFALVLINAPAEPGQVILADKFLRFLQQNHTLHTLLIGVLLYSLMTIFVFHTELHERTLSAILTIPLSRMQFIISKFIVLLLWAFFLAFVMLCVVILLAFITRMETISLVVIMDGVIRYFASSVLLLLLTIPIAIITLFTKTYVVPLGFTILFLIVNIIAINTRDLIFIFPWSIPFVLTNYKEAIAPNQIFLSLCILFGFALLSGLLLIRIFRKMDVA